MKASIQKPLVFLDFDGVLHPVPAQGLPMDLAGIRSQFGQTLFMPDPVRRIRQLCEQTGAGIVLITTWLLLGYPTGFYNRLLGGHVLGQISEPVNSCAHVSREEGVLEYLDAMGQDNPFVIVDDKASQFQKLKRQVVSPEPYTGFSAADFAMALNILQGSRNK